MESSITYCKFTHGDESQIEKMILEVYNEFVAPDYSDMGNDYFYEFVKAEEILSRFLNGIDDIYLAKDGDKIIGVLTVKLPNHISLFFTHKQYQGRGVAKTLFQQLSKDVKARGLKEITVHASPYSEAIYQKFGFEPSADMKETFGIKYIPMKFTFAK